MKMADKYDVIIIGAGMGGLSCGAWLAKKRLKVLVVEQNSKVGGAVSSFKRDGFTFDAGASVFPGLEEGGIIRTLLRNLDVEKDLGFIRQDQPLTYVLPDFIVPMQNLPGTQEQLSSLFPHEAENISTVFSDIDKLWKQLGYSFFFGLGPLDMAKILVTSRILTKLMRKSVTQYLDEHFTDPKLKAIFTMPVENLVGVRASRAPALTMVMYGMFLTDKPYYPGGGTQTMVDALAQGIRDNGGEVLLSSLAEKILIEKNKAFGVRVVSSPLAQSKGEGGKLTQPKEILGRYIVSNSDACKTFFNLVGEENLPKRFAEKLRGYERAHDILVVYLGVDTDLKKEGITPSFYMFSSSYDIEDMYVDIEQRILAGKCPPLSTPLYQLHDPTVAPEGMSCVSMHFVPAPPPQWRWDAEVKEKIADMMIRSAENVIPDLSKHIVVKEIGTPQTIEKYTLSTYLGWALRSGELSKKLDYQTPVKNLFLTGQWTKDGGNVLFTTISGLKTARLILAKEGVKGALAELGY